MNKFIYATIFSMVIAHLSIASLQSDQFEETGFSKKSVVGSWFQAFDSNSKEFKAYPSSASLTQAAIDSLSHAEPSKTKEVDYIYILTLLTGSSFDSQKLAVYMDSAGNGYFQHGKKPVVYFHSLELGSALEKYAHKTEQDAAANP